MKLYSIVPSEFYQNYELTEYNYELEKKYGSSEKILDEWGCQEIKTWGKGKSGDLGCCGYLGGALILNKKALEELSSIFGEDVEFLPVKFGEEIWHIVHSTNIEEKMNFSVRGRVVQYRIFKNGPREMELCDKYYFRVRNSNGIPTDMIYTEKFVNLIKSLKLKGIELDETGEIMEES